MWSFLSVVVITCALHAQGRRFEPGRKQNFVPIYYVTSSLIETILLLKHLRFHGVMVSTLDFESSDPSSNLGGTWTPWRNGSASDSRSEGCVFESRRGHNLLNIVIFFWKKMFASNEDWTHDLWFTRPTLCHWAIEAFLISTLKILLLVKDKVRMYKCFNVKWPWLSECTSPLFK